MAKDVNYAFTGGDGVDRTMKVTYPYIRKDVLVPIGKMEDRIEIRRAVADLGWKTRVQNFRALPKELSDTQKDQIASDSLLDYCAHLSNGGEWRMDAERGLTADLVEAVIHVMPQMTEAKLQEAYKADSDQTAKWRKHPEVKVFLAERAFKKAKAAAKAGEKQELVINGI
jgi:hypothetical protein